MTNKETDPLLVILGPTASGKTALAVALAQKLKAEIISADSRQVYQSMDIGTGKDLAEYQDIPYHLIDIIPPGEQYNLSIFQADFQDAFEAIRIKNKPSILCGGSGMYIQAVLQNFQQTNIPKNETLRTRLALASLEELKKELNSYSESCSFNHAANPTSKRQLIRAIEVAQMKGLYPNIIQNTPLAPIPHLIFGLAPQAAIRRERISQRLKIRIKQGLIQEVENLLKMGIMPEQLIYYGLEYKWTTLYLQNEMSYDEFFEKLEVSIHQFAKRQMTYFRKMEKDGLKIEWINNESRLDEQLHFIQQKREDFLNL